MTPDMEGLKKNFIERFRYRAVFSDDMKKWDDICKKCNYIPVEYLSTSLCYQHTYVQCFNESVTDLSVVIYGQNEAICCWPLTLIVNGNKGILSTNEKEVLPPIFVPGTPTTTKNHVIGDCLNAINAVFFSLRTSGIEIDTWQTRCSQLIDMSRNSAFWYRRCMENNGETDVITDLYVDLRMDLDEIHACLRKRYKALINRAGRLWNTEILDHLTDEETYYFRQRHIEVAGRETRSLQTWLMQQLAVNSGYAFVVKLMDCDGNFVGESLFEHSRDECSYSVGVYNRQLFDEPISHIVQWAAIKHMKTLGLSRYKIGQRFYPGRTLNLRTPTPKELSISYFKEGFATDYIHTLIVTNRVKD